MERQGEEEKKTQKEGRRSRTARRRREDKNVGVEARRHVSGSWLARG